MMGEDDRRLRPDESLQEYGNRLSSDGGGLVYSLSIPIRIMRSKGFEYKRRKWLENRPKDIGNIVNFLQQIEVFADQLIEDSYPPSSDGKEPFEVFAGRTLKAHARKAFEITQTTENIFEFAYHIQLIYELLFEPIEKQSEKLRKGNKKGGKSTAKMKKEETQNRNRRILDDRESMLKRGKEPRDISGILANKYSLSQRRINQILKQKK